MPDPPPVQDGFTRVSIIPIEGDGVNGAWEVIDRSKAEMQAEWDVTEAVRKATPVIFDQPIETPFVTVQSQTGAKGVGITALDDGTLVPFIVHESPWPDKAALKAKIDAAVALKKDQHDKGKATKDGSTKDRIEAIERFLGWRT